MHIPADPVHPQPQAEPFKRWLAKVGYERIQEIEDPELATKRTHALYRAKYDQVERPFCAQLKAMGWQWIEGGQRRAT